MHGSLYELSCISYVMHDISEHALSDTSYEVLSPLVNGLHAKIGSFPYFLINYCFAMTEGVYVMTPIGFQILPIFVDLQ